MEPVFVVRQSLQWKTISFQAVTSYWDVLLILLVYYNCRHGVVVIVIAARPMGPSAANPAPYQRGPPQEYLEAVTNKRLTEEVSCCQHFRSRHSGTWFVGEFSFLWPSVMCSRCCSCVTALCGGCLRCMHSRLEDDVWWYLYLYL